MRFPGGQRAMPSKVGFLLFFKSIALILTTLLWEKPKNARLAGTRNLLENILWHLSQRKHSKESKSLSLTWRAHWLTRTDSLAIMRASFLVRVTHGHEKHVTKQTNAEFAISQFEMRSWPRGIWSSVTTHKNLPSQPSWPPFHQTLDYMMWRWSFCGFVSCVTISNPDSLSSSETGINPGIKTAKSTDLNLLDAIKPLVVSTSQKKWKAATLQPALRFDNFKPWLKKGVSSSDGSPASTIHALWGDEQGFLIVGVKTYLTARTSPLNSPATILPVLFILFETNCCMMV